MRDFPWNERSIARLEELIAEKLSAREIAAVLSNEFHPATRNTVIGKCHRLKLQLHIRPSGVKPGTPSPLKGRTVKERKAPVRIARPKYVEPGDTGERLPPTPDAFAIPVSNRVKLLDLRETHCRFPFGSPTDEEFGFCGEFAPAGTAYCSAHAQLCYRASDRARAEARKLLKWAMSA